MDLSRREKLWLLIGGVVLLPLLIYRFVYTPVLEQHQRTIQQNLALESKIQQIGLLGQELKFYKNQSRGSIPKLSRRVDQVLRRLQLKSKSRISIGDSPKNGQRLVLRLDLLNLTEFVQLTYQLENMKPTMLIESMELSPSFQNNQLLRANISLASR
ncbi:MAG: hypothetical protein COB67_01375 [SAR324 cluster bacterium]|uniref:Type II secretion system protein M n=1 Tax=SAR324 cluster bacterium TaxID=2024889 RepID=A0A2A4TAS2_9DELT|nr:MAG: hypothetical protein COB67_01375 [SAR324 cluster bacterium]